MLYKGEYNAQCILLPLSGSVVILLHSTFSKSTQHECVGTTWTRSLAGGDVHGLNAEFWKVHLREALSALTFLLTQALSLQLTFLVDGEENDEGHDDDEEQGDDRD